MTHRQPTIFPSNNLFLRPELIRLIYTKLIIKQKNLHKLKVKKFIFQNLNLNFFYDIIIQLCYPTALHPEGIFVLKSVTDVISKIKAKISPRLETFYHPEIDDSHRDFLNFPRNRKTLTDALESGRHVTCCVKNEAQGKF